MSFRHPQPWPPPQWQPTSFRIASTDTNGASRSHDRLGVHPGGGVNLEVVRTDGVDAVVLEVGASLADATVTAGRSRRSLTLHGRLSG